MNAVNLRITVARILLAIAYMSCAMQWLWIFSVGLPPLIDGGTIDFLMPMGPQPDSTRPRVEEFSPLVLIIAGIVTLVMIIVTIIVLIRLPKTVATVGHSIVRETAEIVIPAVTHHKPMPARKKRALTRRVTFGLQIAATLLPLFIALTLAPTGELSRLLINIVALFFAAISLISFLVSWAVRPVQITSRTRSRASRG